MKLTSVARLAVAAALAMACMPAVTHAADPYFVPYGAHRGRIHIGPRHARIRWGGGITPYGAAVLIHGFDVAGTVITGTSSGGSNGGDGHSPLSSESAEAECQEQLRKTRELLEETKRACSLKQEAAPDASMEPGSPPAAAPRDEYARIESVRRQVVETLPLIGELEKNVAASKKSIEEFERTLARDRRAFEAFKAVYDSQ